MAVLAPLRFERNGMRVNAPQYCKCHSVLLFFLERDSVNAAGSFARDNTGNVVYSHGVNLRGSGTCFSTPS